MQNLYKKFIVVAGLAGILNGCTENKIDYKTTQIFKDLNNDAKPEQVYLVMGQSHWSYNDYDLFVRECKGENFGEPKLLQRFKVKPEEIKIEDLNGDGKQDLVYLVMGQSHWSYNDYDLMVRYGNGDGTFQEPTLVQRFKNKPEGLN